MRTVLWREQHATAEPWRSFISFVFSLLDTLEIHRIMLNGCCWPFARTGIQAQRGGARQVRAGRRTILSKYQCHTCQRDHIPRIEHRLARALPVHEGSPGGIQIKEDEAAL